VAASHVIEQIKKEEKRMKDDQASAANEYIAERAQAQGLPRHPGRLLNPLGKLSAL